MWGAVGTAVKRCWRGCVVESQKRRGTQASRKERGEVGARAAANMAARRASEEQMARGRAIKPSNGGHMGGSFEPDADFRADCAGGRAGVESGARMQRDVAVQCSGRAANTRALVYSV
ncbi:hypothetical protein FGB62_3g255 [Gracilaria domingensis]|nr:hypothetical protein FGB62_3g255 [Gracilaria domingensis]